MQWGAGPMYERVSAGQRATTWRVKLRSSRLAMCCRKRGAVGRREGSTGARSEAAGAKFAARKAARAGELARGRGRAAKAARTWGRGRVVGLGGGFSGGFVWGGSRGALGGFFWGVQVDKGLGVVKGAGELDFAQEGALAVEGRVAGGDDGCVAVDGGDGGEEEEEEGKGGHGGGGRMGDTDGWRMGEEWRIREERTGAVQLVSTLVRMSQGNFPRVHLTNVKNSGKGASSPRLPPSVGVISDKCDI